MKKQIVSLVMLALAGCASEVEVVQTCTYPTSAEDAPSWVCDPAVPVKEPTRFVVSSAQGSGDYELVKELAMNRGQQQLYSTLMLEVRRDTYDEYQRDSELGLETSSEAYQRVFSTTLSSQMYGMRLYRTVTDASGRVWVLVGLPEAQIKRAQKLAELQLREKAKQARLGKAHSAGSMLRLSNEEEE